MKVRPSLEALISRDRTVVLLGIAGIAALAWVYVVRLAATMNGGEAMDSGMDAMDSAGWFSMPLTGDWTLASYGLVFSMWAVMMVAMMLPSAAPMVLTFATLNRRRREQERPFVPTAVFVTGYVLVWGSFAAAAALSQWGFQRASLVSSEMVATSGILGGLVLVAAGAYQWSPLKRACLTACRTPLTFIMTEWRDGAPGAVVMGLRHGLYCLGCCWVLMALLFVGGVMNLIWVAAIAVFVLAEKATPRGAPLITRASGVALAAWGVWTLSRAL